MKIKTVLVAGLAGGIAYVLGTKAGRGRYEELKVQADRLRIQADRLANNPQVRETVANVADKVKETAEKLPVADVVAKVTGSGTASGSGPDAGSTSTGPAESAPSSTSTAPADPGPGGAGSQSAEPRLGSVASQSAETGSGVGSQSTAAPGDVTPPPVDFPTTFEATGPDGDTDDTGPVEPGIRPGV